MKTNVFLRSTRRQPVRTAALLLVTALITFAFVSRGAEYLAIRQETERLAGYYHSIGSVQTISGELYRDAREVAAYLESNPLVGAVNTYNYVSGVIQDDVTNVNTSSRLGTMSQYFAFYGTLTTWNDSQFRFRADEVVEGFPEIIESGREVVLTRDAGKRAEQYLSNETLRQYYDMMLEYYADTIMLGDPDDPDLAYEQLEQGQRYLVIGYYNPLELPGACRVDYNSGDDSYTTYAYYSHSLADTFFYPVPEGEADWSDPKLDTIRRHLDLIHDEQHALNLVPLQDMTVHPLTQEGSGGIYLTEGRWLDSEDNARENRVCVVTNAFASGRGLKLGDTLTIKLRDIPSYFGQFIASDYYTYGGDPWTLDPDSLKTTPDAVYEIVGIYDYLDNYDYYGYLNTDVQNFVYVPAFALPEDFQLDYGDADFASSMTGRNAQIPILLQGTSCPLPYPGSVTFELIDPASESQFLEEAEPVLTQLGFAADFEENGWESFQQVSAPMRESSLYNVAVYSVVMLATLGLAAFIYFFSRRREMQIARSIGLRKTIAARQIMVPLLLAGGAAILSGSAAGWWYALRSASEMLASLPAVAGVEAAGAALPATWLALLCGVPLLLLAVLTAGGACFLAGQPLVRQQMGGKKVEPSRTAGAARSAAPVRSALGPAGANVSAFAAVSTPRSVTKTSGAAHVLRFVWRYMIRSWAKSLLTVALAVVFTVSLTVIQVSIADNRQKVDALYERTQVSLELVKADSSQETTAGAFLFEDTLQTILDTGFVVDSYVEGANYCSMFRYEEDWTPGEPIVIHGERPVNRTIRSIDDVEKFLSGKSGSGQHAELHYTGGWDGSLFSEDWDASSGAAFPVILPEETWNEYGLEGGELMGVSCKGVFRMCEVAGYYTGEVGGSYSSSSRYGYNENLPILMPTSALRTMVPNMLYCKAVFDIDPARNRDLDSLRAAIEDLANTPHIGGVPVRTLLRDEELRMVVEPIEASIRLMQVLYPVTLILSLLAAGGVSALLVVLSAKEAAMMRIQGTTRARTILMLSLQQTFTCTAGLLIGLIGILFYLGGTRPDLFQSIIPGAAVCAVLYLAAGVIGAAASSAAVTGKNPLEMLQVKE